MSARNRIYRTLVAPFAVGTTVICAAALTATPAQAAPSGVTVTQIGALLTITGDSAANSLAVGTNAASVITLNGAPVLGGTATTANILEIVLDGGAGNDTLLDRTPGTTLLIDFRGGEGNDQLIGGPKAESLAGGPGADTLVGNAGDDTLIGDAGNDKAIGGPGEDTVRLGGNSDQFTWNPGDGNDRVDGDAGTDTLILNGFDRAPADPFEAESLQFRSDGARSTITRIQLPAPNEANDVISLRGFELVKALLAGGPNGVFFDENFAASDVGVVRVDLGPPTDATRDQGVLNSVQIFAGAGPDRIRVTGSPASGATVTGVGPTEVITRAEDLLLRGDSVSDGSDDVIDASGLGAGTVAHFAEYGVDGNDTLIGSPGNDVLVGGRGHDRLEGRGGHDVLDGGPEDVIIP